MQHSQDAQGHWIVVLDLLAEPNGSCLAEVDRVVESTGGE